jgi:hypothetical protein
VTLAVAQEGFVRKAKDALPEALRGLLGASACGFVRGLLCAAPSAVGSSEGSLAIQFKDRRAALLRGRHRLLHIHIHSYTYCS